MDQEKDQINQTSQSINPFSKYELLTHEIASTSSLDSQEEDELLYSTAGLIQRKNPFHNFVISSQVNLQSEKGRLSLDDLEAHSEEVDLDLSEQEIDQAIEEDLDAGQDDKRLSLDDLEDHTEDDTINSSGKSFKEELQKYSESDVNLDLDLEIEEELDESKNGDDILQKKIDKQENLSQSLFNYEDNGEEKTDENDLEEEELKDILLYLDQLFGDLPESVIKDFARSSYYDRYNNLLDKLEI